MSTNTFSLEQWGDWVVNDGRVAIRLVEKEKVLLVGDQEVEVPSNDGDEYAREAIIVKVGAPLPGQPQFRGKVGGRCTLPKIPSMKFATKEGYEIMIVPFLDIDMYEV